MVKNKIVPFYLLYAILVFLLITSMANAQFPRLPPDAGPSSSEYTRVSVRQRHDNRQRQGSDDQEDQGQIQGFGMGLNLDGGLSGHGGMTVLGGPMTSRGARFVKVDSFAKCRGNLQQSASSTTTTTEMTK